MSDKWSSEVHRRVYDDSQGVYLTVAPDGDSLGLVEIRTDGPANEDYFGKVRVALPPVAARLLAAALLAACDEAENA